MNWAIVIVGAELLFSGAYWVYAARFKYMKDSPTPAMILHGQAVTAEA